MPCNYTITKECEVLAESIYGDDYLQEKNLKRTLVMKNSEAQKIIKRLKETYKAHLKNIGKGQTISVEKIFELHKRKKIPDMIKHCVVAVMPKVRGGQTERFIGAHNICYWSFKRYKLVNEKFLMTSRGRVREDYHTGKEDTDRSKKNQKYEQMFKKVYGKAKK